MEALLKYQKERLLWIIDASNKANEILMLTRLSAFLQVADHNEFKRER